VESQSPVRLYCAYTSLVDRPTFARLWEDCTASARPLPAGRRVDIVDMDVAFNCPSLAWGGRIAGLVPSPGKRVPALLYAVDAQDWHALELAEEFPDRVPITVRIDMDGVELRAQAFTTRISQSTSLTQVSRDALDILIRGAQAADFPAEYIARLKAEPESESLLTPDLLLGGVESAV
jgi:AIG2 family protein